MGNFDNKSMSFYTMLYKYYPETIFFTLNVTFNFIHIIISLDWNDYYTQPQHNTL